MILFIHRMPSPIGDLGLMVDESERVVRIAFEADCAGDLAVALERFGDSDDRLVEDSARITQLRSQLEEYFSGERREFDLELAPRGTDFQKQVWQFLLEIPAGETRTYSEIARQLGRPGAARAVGRANATNPIPIIVPCHRVIGADGTLTGYAGGLEVKRSLLAIEGEAMLPF